AKVHLCFRKEEWREPLIQPNAKTLYALLRDADRKNVSDIYVDCNEQIQKDAAIMNRLLRASGQIH
ncbi:MAG: hypothetical protein KGQ49_06850, partial [Verrucomicrobia bacterium]|nr:hypothetical protein [Verrucomicrobiota bacterium]